MSCTVLLDHLTMEKHAFRRIKTPSQTFEESVPLKGITKPQHRTRKKNQFVNYNESHNLCSFKSSIGLPIRMWNQIHWWIENKKLIMICNIIDDCQTVHIAEQLYRQATRFVLPPVSKSRQEDINHPMKHHTCAFLHGLWRVDACIDCSTHRK